MLNTVINLNPSLHPRTINSLTARMPWMPHPEPKRSGGEGLRPTGAIRSVLVQHRNKAEHEVAQSLCSK